MKSPRHLLLDANSLLLLIRSDEEARTVKSPIIEDSKILDLTVYEIGNGVWKELEPFEISRFGRSRKTCE